MNALNPLVRPPVVSSLNPHRPFISKSPSSISPRFPHPPRPRFPFAHPVRAFLQNAGHGAPSPSRQPTNPFIRQATDGIGLKATLVTTVAAAALIFPSFCFYLKPSTAAPISPPPASETSDFAQGPVFQDEEREKVIEESLLSNPNDVDQLKDLMEIKIKSKKIPEAIDIVERLMKLDPEGNEWPMMRAHLHAHYGDLELAGKGFNDLMKKDPFCVEAYHGLVTVASSHGESGQQLKDIENRVEEAMKLCMKERKKSDVRDFKLLLAQIKVLESRYEEALKIYQDLVREEPRDFRPYLCQGIIYTLLQKNKEAEKNFEKYRRLVPRGHPYASYFDDNMIATKIFAQRAEKEKKAMAKR